MFNSKETQQVTHEVVDDIGLIAFPHCVQVDGTVFEPQCQPLQENV